MKTIELLIIYVLLIIPFLLLLQGLYIKRNFGVHVFFSSFMALVAALLMVVNNCAAIFGDSEEMAVSAPAETSIFEWVIMMLCKQRSAQFIYIFGYAAVMAIVYLFHRKQVKS